MTQQQTAQRIIDANGQTFAEQAKITLKDEPSPLYRMFVLANLLSARISADIAISAAAELSSAGFRTAERMRDATWQQRVDALGRGGYRRYDESTATRLGDGAEQLLDQYGGDLRRLRDAGENARGISEKLQEFPGIGPTGASIFLREVQGIWPAVAPYFDKKALDDAESAGLPRDPEKLAALVPAEDLPRLAAALVRQSLSR